MVRADLLRQSSGAYRTRCAILRPFYSTARDGTSVVSWTLHGWRHMAIEPVASSEIRIGPRVLDESECVARMPYERGIKSDMRVLFPLPCGHLTAGASNVDTVFMVTGGDSHPETRSGPFSARCENEIVRVVGGHGTGVLQVQRGRFGTLAVSHEAGVMFVPLREYNISGVIDVEDAHAEILLGLNGAQQ